MVKIYSKMSSFIPPTIILENVEWTIPDLAWTPETINLSTGVQNRIWRSGENSDVVDEEQLYTLSEIVSAICRAIVAGQVESEILVNIPRPFSERQPWPLKIHVNRHDREASVALHRSNKPSKNLLTI